MEVVDSSLTLEEALAGSAAPQEILDTLVLVSVPYYSFDTALHRGQLVVHTDVAQEVAEIFEKLLAARFPIRSVVPIVAYDWDDERSMRADNTSAFNYRSIAGTNRLSTHSRGLAIDINPRTNPCYQRDGTIVPSGASYDASAQGALAREGPVVQAFLTRGWAWGGDWQSLKDWQHFEKPFV